MTNKGNTDTNKHKIYFTDVSAMSGINYQHTTGAFITTDGSESRYMPETMGSGVVLFDYDNDNDLDIFINNSTHFDQKNSEGSTPELYENLGNLRFKNISQQAGFIVPRHGMGAIAADYNGDGYQDILMTGFGGPWLYKNLGDKRFQYINSQVGIKPESWHDQRGNTGYNWSTGAVFFDADGDQDLDLFVINYVKWSPQADIYTTFDAIRKGYTSPRSYEGTTPQLYIQKNGMFELKNNFIRGERGGNKITSKSLGVALWDFNNDHKLDIIVANDTQRNFYFSNLGNGQFDERAIKAGIAYNTHGNPRAGMGIDITDYLNDGSAGVAIGNFQGEPTSLFLLNKANNTFQEVNGKSNINKATLSILTFGLTFADFNLDGWQDLIMANGHTEPYIQDVQSDSQFRQSMTLLGNLGNGKFEDWSQLAGPAIQKKIVGRGLAVGDLDSDGDLDIVVTCNGSGLKLLRNDSHKQNYIRIHLRDKAPNTDAIGAKLTLTSGNLIQQRIIRTGSSYLSQSEFTQTFGLGNNTKVDSLIVHWPDGTKNYFLLPNINKTYTIIKS